MRESSGLARAVATLDSARLAREKARRAIARKLSRALVIEYLAQLDPLDRSNLFASVEAMGEVGSVLS